MTWEVQSEYEMSASQQNAFIRIVENGIKKHGTEERYEVAKYIRRECEDEFPAKGQSWLVIFDTNGSFGVAYSAYKRIHIKNADKWDFVYAYRV